jgi:hypothetical protein
MIMFERMLSSAVVTGFFGTMRAMLNDKLSMAELVVANGAISTYAGLGVMIGPFIETAVLSTSAAGQPGRGGCESRAGVAGLER